MQTKINYSELKERIMKKYEELAETLAELHDTNQLGLRSNKKKDLSELEVAFTRRLQDIEYVLQLAKIYDCVETGA